MPTLDWLNRANAFTLAAKVPYRLLAQVSTHHATAPLSELLPRPSGVRAGVRGSAPPDNLLIQGDNLEAIKALLPFYRGQVKCIFIDPPYNTKSAFEHYDDNLEHAQWLSMMLPRLQLLRELLREDGSIWVTIDDNEGHYLKVLMDEVFGRGNFVANVVWEKVYTPKSNGRGLSGDHDHLLVFSKSPTWLDSGWNMVPRTEEQKGRFKNPDSDENGPWRTYPLDVRTEDGGKREKYRYEVALPSGRTIKPSPGRHWALPAEEFIRQRAADEIYFGKDGDAMPTKKVYLRDANAGVIARTWWPYKEVTGNQDAKREVLTLFGDSGFITPKPEKLIERVLIIASNKGDLILDSFLGSGTTAAVAHKMGRRWIGIEMGEHAATHCLPRLVKVINGEQGGISKAVNWQGGGSFRFMQLGAPVFDDTGRIHPGVRFATLAAFIWQQETGTAFDALGAKPGTPYLGTNYVFDSWSRPYSLGLSPIEASKTAPPTGTAYYLLFNGILGDKRPASGNVLTQAVLDALLTLHAATPDPTAPLRVYGEACRLGEARLALAKVTFKHIPYDVRAR